MATSSDELLTVIVPCLNEAANVEATVADILAHVPMLPVRVEVLLIDDGSTDGTREVMQSLCERHSSCRMLLNERTLGVGRSVVSAYRMIPGHSWVTVIPGDNELCFESIGGFLTMRDRYDVVIGYLQNSVIRPLRRRLASHVYSVSVRTVYGLPYRYLNGLKLYRVEAFHGIEVVSSGYGFNAELLAKALLRNPFLRVGEAPFIARGRRGGASKAFRPAAIARAVWEFQRGRAAVTEYRDEVLSGDHPKRK